MPGTWEAFTKYLCNEYKWDEVGKGQNEKHNGTETECVWVWLLGAKMGNILRQTSEVMALIKKGFGQVSWSEHCDNHAEKKFDVRVKGDREYTS